jgi:hypothetical protein
MVFLTVSNVKYIASSSQLSLEVSQGISDRIPRNS